MDCSAVRRLLPDFLEGELSPAEVQEVREHVLECDSCRKELLALKKAFSRPRPSLISPSSDDWPDVLGRRFQRGGPWSGFLSSLLLPWEKKIPLLTGALILILILAFSLRQVSCRPAKEGRHLAVPSPTAPPPAAPAAEKVRLKKNPAGSVFILEEEPAAGSEVKGGGGAPASPGGNYDPFQDQQVKLYAREVDAALNQAVEMALSSGGQLINFPIKGFENLGPQERTLVFDIRTYRPFLQKLVSLGKVEHPPIRRSDFVTVRLTVLPRAAATPAGK